MESRGHSRLAFTGAGTGIMTGSTVLRPRLGGLLTREAGGGHDRYNGDPEYVSCCHGAVIFNSQIDQSSKIQLFRPLDLIAC